MTFEIHSDITNRSMTVAARAMRKVLRRKRNIIWAIFGEDSYTVVTVATTSTFRYELIDALAESQDYIIFLMKKRYAQPLDKRTLTGGTVEEFKRFLEEKTGKTFRRVK